MTQRVMLGALGGGAYGLRVSRPGYDVTDAATKDKKLAFDSRWPAALNLVASGTGTVPNSAPYYTTISFGATLPSIPILIVVPKLSGSYYAFGADTIETFNASSFHDQVTTTGATISTHTTPPFFDTPFCWYAFLP